MRSGRPSRARRSSSRSRRKRCTCSRRSPVSASPATSACPPSDSPPPPSGRPPQRRRPAPAPPRSTAASPEAGPTEQVSEGVHMRIRSTIGAVATAGAVALLTAGCLSSGGGGGGSSNTSNTIEIMYGFTGQQDKDFQAVVKPWADKNDITIKFSPASNFNQLINTRVQGNQLPDIAIFPQPGIMRSIAKSGKMADLSSVLDMNEISSNMLEGAVKAGQGEDGKQYALLISSNIKSTVYYPLQAATAAGITQPPQTMDQLMQ